MDPFKHPRIRGWMELLDLLEKLAERHAAQRQARRRGPASGSRYRALKPGSQTPLWNELVALAVKRFWRRGDKTNLGRYLGLPRQRIHKLLVERSACPDAERTLLLLVWVRARLRDSRFV
jgi:hypothetical protein